MFQSEDNWKKIYINFVVVFSQVKFICGQVRWSNTSENLMARSVTKLPENYVNWSADEDDSNFRSSLLSSKIRQFQDSIPMSRGFYSNLADTLCTDDSFAEKRDTASCWNGQRVAELVFEIIYDTSRFERDVGNSTETFGVNEIILENSLSCREFFHELPILEIDGNLCLSRLCYIRNV